MAPSDSGCAVVPAEGALMGVPLTAGHRQFVDQIAHSKRDDKSIRRSLGLLSGSYGKGPAATSEDPAQMFTRFALSGFDSKGAVSSGAAQLGFGLEIAVGADLGTFVLPGVLRVPVKIGASGERTDYTMLAVTRLPRTADLRTPSAVGSPTAAANERQDRSPGTPAYSTTRPIVAMLLAGSQWRAGLNASAGVLVGVGDVTAGGVKDIDMSQPGNRTVDELSFGVGVTARTDHDWTCALLIDDAPLAFASQLEAPTFTEADSIAVPPLSLADYVNSMLVGDVERRITVWLAEEIFKSPGVGRTGRRTPPRNVVEWFEAQGWSQLSTRTVDAEIDGGGALRDFVEWVRTHAKKHEFDQLKSQLETVHRGLRHHRPRTAAGPDALARYRRNLAAVVRFSAMLDAARFQKQSGGSPVFAQRPDARPSAANAPTSLLRMISNRHSLDLTAAAGFGLPTGLDPGGRRSKIVAGGKAKEGKFTSFRFQTVNTSTPVRLVMTQDTAIDQTIVTTESPKAGTQGKRWRYGAFSYRSATAYWIDDDPRTITALPSGTGVSFGVSIDSARLAKYAAYCPNAVVGRPARTGSDLRAVEDLLLAALHVPMYQLHSFLLDYELGPLVRDPGLGDDYILEDTAVLVESSFRTKAPVELDPDQRSASREPIPLLDSPMFTERMGASPSAVDLPLTTLEVMRVRYRKRRAEDNTHPLLEIGWESGSDDEEEESAGVLDLFNKIDEPGPPPVKLEGGIQRVERIAAEGIVDLYVRMFPNAVDSVDGVDDLIVPPVALFAQ